MQPLVPTFLINDLAREHFADRVHHPDVFVADASVLAPDPVSISLRLLGHWGPIGAIRRWIDRAIREHEERRQVVDHPQDVTIVEIDRFDDDIAA